MHGLFPWPMPSHSAHPMYADQQKESLQCSHLTNHQNLHEGLNHQNQFHNHQKGKVQFQSEKGLQAMHPLWPFLCPHLHPQLRLETPTSSAHCQQECVAPSGSRSPSHAPTLTVTPFTPPLWSQGPRPSVELVRIQNAAPSGSRSQVTCPLQCTHFNPFSVGVSIEATTTNTNMEGTTMCKSRKCSSKQQQDM